MSVCDNDLFKKCYVCNIILLKDNFHKNKAKKDKLNSECNFCKINIIMKI